MKQKLRPNSSKEFLTNRGRSNRYSEMVSNQHHYDKASHSAASSVKSNASNSRRRSNKNNAKKGHKEGKPKPLEPEASGSIMDPEEERNDMEPEEERNDAPTDKRSDQRSRIDGGIDEINDILCTNTDDSLGLEEDPSVVSRTRTIPITALGYSDNRNGYIGTLRRGAGEDAPSAQETLPTSQEHIHDSVCSSFYSNGSHNNHKVTDEYIKAMEEKLRHQEVMNEKLKAAAGKSQSKNQHLLASSPPALDALPWTDNEREILRDQVAFFKNCLIEYEGALSQKIVRDILTTLYTALRQDSLSRSDRLLRELAQKMEGIQTMDLQHLAQLMAANEKAGDSMEGQDVILLTGACGSGKTTTLHFLAGTKFEETEIDGFVHLQPTEFANTKAEGFKTACGNEAVTKTLQALPVPLNDSGDSVVVCDAPGTSNFALTSEEELAFQYGLGSAIERAKRIKPVVVLNQEFMGSCFSNLADVLEMMKQDLGLKSAKDLIPIEYVFTNYEERHRPRLCQQFASLKHIRGLHGGSNKMTLFDELVHDIIAKTTPNANVAIPLEDDPNVLLADLWKESFIVNPKRGYFKIEASEMAFKKLKLQLQVTLEELRMALSREIYSVALNRMVVLDKLSVWFPQAKETALLAQEAASNQVKIIWDWMAQEVRESNYEQALYRMEQMSDFGLIFPDAQECSKRGHDLLWESLAAPMDEQNYNVAMERIVKVNDLSEQFNEASQCVKRALRLLRKKIDLSIDSGYFKEAMSILVPLHSLTDNLAEAKDCADSILSRLKELLETTITRKNYPMALHMIRRFGSLESIYPEVKGTTEGCMALFRRTVETSVNEGDYESALFLVQNMQRLELDFPQAKELAMYGLGVFQNTVEVLITHKNYQKAIPLMKKVSEEVPGSAEFILKGLSLLKEELKQAVKEKEYENALDIIIEVNNLAKTVHQADACIEYGFNALEENILASIERHEYQSAVDLMELISARQSRLPLAKECNRIGIEVLKRNVAKAIEGKEYSPALEMIQQLSDKGHNIPEVGECSRRGLEMLNHTAENAIAERDYDTAIEIITNISELTGSLPEAKACTLSAIRLIVCHVTELRQGVEKTVEEVAQTRDLKVFVAMLLKLKAQIEKVMKSEPLRKLSVQIHYKKNFRTKEEEESEASVLFVPQLYTSQAFCSDHIELLAGRVREKLPDFDVNDTCMESLIRNRKAILSVMIRLKATHKILQHCPGGDKATSVYTNTFENFHALVDIVLSIAEETLNKPLDIRNFELQAWFLSVLIKGFIKDKIDIGSEERGMMEELENRRKVMMLQFEVQVSEALELISEHQDFVEMSATQDNSIVQGDWDNGSKVSKDGSKSHIPIITAELIHKLDFACLEKPRNFLLSLSQRPELFRMVPILKQQTFLDVEQLVHAFDKSLVQYFGPLVKWGEDEYNSLIAFAKTGKAKLPVILEKANELKSHVDKVESHLQVVRAWGQDFVNATTLVQQKTLILQKRIELATEKLESTIRSARDLGFGAFVTHVALGFQCDGRWYDDVPTSFL